MKYSASHSFDAQTSEFKSKVRLEKAMTSTSSLNHLSGWRKKQAEPGGLADCSLIVATYMRDREMVSLLDTVASLPDPPGEVIVVDGSLSDKTEVAISAWARSRTLKFDLIFVKTQPGLTRQRNVGIDASTREFVFFLDDDCKPEPGYFRAIRQTFIDDSSKVIGAVCGSIINEMDKPLGLRWRIRLMLRLVPRGESGKYYPTATSVPRGLVSPFIGSRPVDIIPGCSMAFRSSVLARHRFSLFFCGYSQGEDLEMSMRIGRECKLVWCGDAQVTHNHASGGRPQPAQKGRMEVRNRFFIWKRYTSNPSLLLRANFWLDIAYIFVIDITTFAVHPLQTWYLKHALGIVRGSVECLFSPPRYKEPPARREYSFSISDLDYQGQS